MPLLWISPELKALFSSADPFDTLEKIDGQIFRDVASRKTMRFEYNGKAYFLKMHTGVGWCEIFKNLCRLRLPATSAMQEVRALQQLQQDGIASMSLKAYGELGTNPASKRSFLITDAITDTCDLEHFFHSHDFLHMPYQQKNYLIKKLANLSHRFHQAGYVHHDFYLCHFLLKTQSLVDPQLYVIDCHRVKKYPSLPQHQQVRDLAALYFSSLDCPISSRTILRFIRFYFNLPLRTCLQQHRHLFFKIQKRVRRLYQKVHARPIEDSKLILQGTAKHLPITLQYLECLFRYKAKPITTSRLNDTFLYQENNQDYFVKRYYAAGKGLRRWFGRSRLRGEYDNLHFFNECGLSIPEIALFSEQKRCGFFKRGALITCKVPQVWDLKTLKIHDATCFKNKTWRHAVIERLANYTRQLHLQHFIHHDLKWRNILIDPDNSARIVFIDCPLGRKQYGYRYSRGRVKDLMTLDKEAKDYLSKTDRLRFYLAYLQQTRLTTKDKAHIAKIQAAYK